MFEIKDIDLAGRIGRLYTKHGVIETPAFFPVIDVLRQEVSVDEIRSVGFNQVITNAYLLYRRFGNNINDIHEVLGFNGVVMSDSGAYQILHYGKNIPISQDEIINYQKKINVDIGVILDIPTGRSSYDEAKRTVELTLQRAKEALELIDNDTLWVLPIQGGGYPDLVEFSAKKSSEIDYKYSIYGIGSPTVFLERYEYDVVLKNIILSKKYLKNGKPVHLFGAGHPLLIPFAVALGVDTFDSASYILYARDGRVFTEFGVDRIERVNRLWCPCNMFGKNYLTVDDLLSKNKKELVKILSIYNLCMIRKYIELTREAIQEGRLWELLQALSRHHPSLFDSFKVISDSSSSFLTRFSPRVKGVVRGIRIYDKYDALNPKILYYINKLKEYTPECINNELLELRPLPANPEDCIINSEKCVIYYHPVLGLVPQELCGTYPSIHLHLPKNIDDINNTYILDLINNIINNIIKRFNFKHVRVIEPGSESVFFRNIYSILLRYSC